MGLSGPPFTAADRREPELYEGSASILPTSALSKPSLALSSWFARIGFHGVVDGVLTLSCRTEIAADRIKRDFVPAILQAAEAAEVFVDRVVLTVRKR